MTMSDSLTFMMGEFEAQFPLDRQYATNHMWAMPVDPGSDRLRFGFTAWSVRLLQDVYFLDWIIDAPAALDAGKEIGSIESKKAESSLYLPVSGTLNQFNPVLMDDPSAINVDKYGDGWLFEMTPSDTSPLLSANEYIELLDSVWDKTQRAIKGQMNQ